MVTLEDVYGHADMMLIQRLHPNWEFFRDDKGVLKCRLKTDGKSDKKEDPTAGTEGASG